MKKIAIYFVASLFSLSLSAQEVVSTSGNTKDVYYSMPNGEIKSESNTNWDLAFEIKGFTGSILINDQRGVAVFSSPFAIADWANFDTAGYKKWATAINSLTTWSAGALSQNPANQFDLGWGKYNISTHAVVGDSIFLLALPDGSFRKLYIKDLTAGVYTFVYAMIDGSNETTKTLKTADFSSQNFGYFTFQTESNVSREPDTKTWDIVFTKYLEPVPVGGGKFQNYPVGGIKINKGIQVAQRNNMMVSSNDTSSLTWSTNLTEIGSDWKQFDGTKYVFAQDQVYFLRLANGSVWKIYFTNYEGGAKGNYHFNKERVAGSLAIEEAANQDILVYPNPAISGQSIQIRGAFGSSVRVVDPFGREIPATLNGEQLSFETPLSAGLYQIQILNEQGMVSKTIAIQ